MEDNVKVEKKSKKLTIIVFIIVLCIAGAAVYVGVRNMSNILPDTQKTIPNLDISNLSSVDGVIDVNSKFKVVSDVDTSIEYLNTALSISPSVDYDIKQISKAEYEIIPKAPLGSNSIYNIVLNDGEGKYKWSFQTEKVFNVVNCYPSDNSYGISDKTVIQIDFSYIPNDDYADFIAFEPSIKGTFKKDGRRVIFTPTEKLTNYINYDIIVKPGLGNTENDNILINEYVSSFEVSIDKNTDNIYIQNVMSFTSNSNISLDFKYWNQLISAFKIQVYQYPSNNEYLEAVNIQNNSENNSSLVAINTKGLSKVIDKKLEASELGKDFDGNYTFDLNTILPEGYYLAIIYQGKTSYYVNIQVNDLVSYTSYLDGKNIVWVNSAKEGTSVEGAVVYRNGEEIGVTNSNGILEFDYQKESSRRYEECITIEKDGYLPLYIFFNEYSYENGSDDQNINAYVFLDRTVYSSNEKVNVWGFVKHRINSSMYNSVELKLYNQYDYINAIETKTINLDEFSTYEANFDLSNYDNGYYYIKVYANDHVVASVNFEVLDYSIKSYNVDMKIDKKVVYANEDMQLDLNVTLFDGTPVDNMKFNYSYFIGANRKSGSVKTDANGNAIVKLDTNYVTTCSDPIFSWIDIYSDGMEAEYERESVYFMLIPKSEGYKFEGVYDNEKDEYVFDVETYMFDKNKEDYIGEATNRVIEVEFEKYERVKILSRVYYDENTKTNKEIYEIGKKFIGSEYATIETNNGTSIFKMKNPLPLDIDGYIVVKSSMKMVNGEVIEENSYDPVLDTTSYYQYDNYSTYSIDYDYSKIYKLNESIYLKVLKHNKEITEDVSIIHVIKSLKGIEVIVTKDTNYEIKFTSDYGTNLSVKTYVFDGKKIFRTGYYSITEYYLSLDEIKLDVDLTLDKTSYSPGDKAKIYVKVSYKGEPVKSVVNLCAVDLAYLAYYNQLSDVIYSMQNNYYFSDTYEKITGQNIIEYFGEGAGGGNDEVRDKFEATAFFKTLVTDEYGRAEIEVQLPDNITSWGILAQGVTNDFKAGKTQKEISVTLPFFATPKVEKEYLIDEEPSILIRANGIAVKAGDDVNYTVTLIDPNKVETVNNVTGKIGEYAYYLMPKLIKGEYTVKVYAKCGEYSDTIINKFEAVSSILKTRQNVELSLVENTDISIEGNTANVYLYNKDSKKLLRSVLELSQIPNIRNDQLVVSALANDLLKELSNKKLGNFKNAPYFDTGIGLMENAGLDIALTAKILSTGYNNINIEGISDYCYEIINDESIDVRQKMFAYWALAAMKQPILNELYELNSEIDNTNQYEKLILALAFCDIGDFNTAKNVYDVFISDTTISSNNKEIFEYLTMLAIKLNTSKAEELYSSYISLDRDSEYSNFVKLFYVQNVLVKNIKDAKVVLNINGENVTYDLTSVGIVNVNLKSSDVVKIVSAKNVLADIEQYTSIEEIDNKGIISKNYFIDGLLVDSFKVGDKVTVRIDIDYTYLNENAKFIYVDDILLNCMIYLPRMYNYDRINLNMINVPYNIDGKKLSFAIYKTDKGNPYIEYDVRITGKGKYIDSGVLLKDNSNRVLDYLKKSNFQI